jgi:hypothetical protein
MEKHSKLEQLAAYLPYGIYCLVDQKHKVKMHSVYSDGTSSFCDLVESEKGFKSIKPILKPLKDIDWQAFINDNHGLMSDAIHDFIDYFNSDAANCNVAILSAPYPVFRWCLQNHYDVFSLIPSGEAIEESKLKTQINRKAKIFVGPSKSGKTRTAKVIAEYLGSEEFAIISGRKFDIKNPFLFSQLSASTKLLIIDDLPNHYNLEKLYPFISNSGVEIKIEKRSKLAEYCITPDLIITTNQIDEKIRKSISFSSRFDVIEFPLNNNTTCEFEQEISTCIRRADTCFKCLEIKQNK